MTSPAPPVKLDPGNNGGSRESSEFEFVDVSRRPAMIPTTSVNPVIPGMIVNPTSPGAQLMPPNINPILPGVSPTTFNSSSPSINKPVNPTQLGLTNVNPLLRPGKGPDSSVSVVASASARVMSSSVSVPAKLSEPGPDNTAVETVRAESPSNPGMFGWVKGSGFLSKVVEKTRTVTENVITTLDPQMKEFIHSGGDIEVVVASDKDDKITPIRDAFQQVFGKATVYGLPAKCSSIAEQPVGFASAKQAAQERISGLRKSGAVAAPTAVVAIENFIYEVNDDIWMDLSCLVLSDPQRKIHLQSFSQPTNIPADYIEKLKQSTPDNYPKQWSGFAVTIGQVMGEELNVPPCSWQEALTGVHRRQLLSLAGTGLAGQYKRALHALVQQI